MINKLKNQEYVNDKIAYTLILRIRTLYIIKKLIENKKYVKKKFEKIIKNIHAENAYKRYFSVKGNKKEENKAYIKEVIRLHKYLIKQLKDVKRRMGKRGSKE